MVFKDCNCISRKFDEVLLCNLFCMDLIAATRAEGGLVCVLSTFFGLYFWVLFHFCSHLRFWVFESASVLDRPHSWGYPNQLADEIKSLVDKMNLYLPNNRWRLFPLAKWWADILFTSQEKIQFTSLPRHRILNKRHLTTELSVSGNSHISSETHH